MAREELDIQYNLVDNYSNQVDRLINKTKEFTQQVKQAQSAAGRGLSSAGSIAGSVGAGSATKGFNLMPVVLGVGATVAALYSFNRALAAVNASFRRTATASIPVGVLNPAPIRISSPLPAPRQWRIPATTPRELWESITGEQRRVKGDPFNRPQSSTGGGLVSEAAPSMNRVGVPFTAAYNALKSLGGVLGPTLIGVLVAVTAAVVSFTVVFEGFKMAISAAMKGMQLLIQQFIKFGQQGIATFANYQTIELGLQAFYGDAKKAKDMMKWLKEFAKTSIMEFSTIAQVAPMLASAGINIKAALPRIADLAAAFGPEKVQELSNALVRAKGGAGFGEVFETMGRIGISRSDFSKQGGMRFSKSGEPIFKQATNSWEEFFDAFQKVALQRAGNMGKVMAGSLNVAFSNLKDSWSQLLATFGAGFAPVLTSLLNKVGKVLGMFDFTDIGKRFGAAIKSFLFDKLPGTLLDTFAPVLAGKDVSKSASMFDVLVGIASYIAAIIATIPEMISVLISMSSNMMSALNQNVVDLWPVLANGFNSVVRILELFAISTVFGLAGIAIGVKALAEIFSLSFADTSQINKMVDGMATAADMIKTYADKLVMDPSKNPITNLRDKVVGIFEETDPILNTIQKRHDEYMVGYDKLVNKKDKKEKSKDEEKKTSIMNTQTSFLYQIEMNTRNLEDLKAFALGGGDLARIGITPQGMYGRGRADITVNGTQLARALEEMIQDSVHQLNAQGAM